MLAATSRTVVLQASSSSAKRACCCRLVSTSLPHSSSAQTNLEVHPRRSERDTNATGEGPQAPNTARLARLMSLYHQTSHFPDFSPQPTAVALQEQERKAPEFCTVPPALGSYITTQIKSRLQPHDTSLLLSAQSNHLQHIPAQHDSHAYLEEPVEVRTMWSHIPDKNRPGRPWPALSKRAPRGAKARALKMLDVLFGTVNVRQAGLGLVEDISRANLETPRPGSVNAAAEGTESSSSSSASDAEIPLAQ